jgi:chemotaxis protein methyltransferase CheR
MSSSANKNSTQVLAEKMSSNVIEEISSIVGKLTGVQFGSRQTAMVQSRLVKRMIELNIVNADDYLSYVNDNFKTESVVLVSLLTTHHTFFFREFFHFEYLLKDALPKVIADAKARGQNKIRIWSAACSHGQEAYSLSMFLNYHLRTMAPGMTYEIYGTDVDPDSVKIARNAVYRYMQIKEIPSIYVGDNWARGTGDIADFVKAKASIKDHCKFDVLNLFDLTPMTGKTFDIIFCRNVFIYFNLEQIKSITSNLLKHMQPAGFLFLGMSESLNGLKLPIKQLGASIYVHNNPLIPVPSTGVVAPSKSAPSKPAPELSIAAPVPAVPLQILCVDDSPVVLSILKKVLSKEHGYEVTTAADGIEAAAKIKTKRFDLMTLDIHMPNQNGIDYLKANFNAQHPPVIMISSVSREDAQFGMKSFELGAVDFIEKPTLANLNEKSDEIRTKIRCALEFYKESRKNKSNNLEKSFQMKTDKYDTSKALRVFVAGLGDVQKLKAVIASLQGDQAPMLIFVHGGDNFLSHFPEQLKHGSRNVKLAENALLAPKMNEILLVPFSKFAEFQKSFFAKAKTHIFVLGEPPASVAQSVVKVTDCYFLLEESNAAKMSSDYEKLKLRSSEVIPYTSMIYHSDRNFVKGS